MSEYYQLVPANYERVVTEESDVKGDVVQDYSRSKILRIEVKTLKLSEGTRQLLVISDITYILRYEKSKIKHNF